MSVDGPVVVYRSRDAVGCHEHALVLTALGIEHAVGSDEGWHVIVVAPLDAPRAREQLQRFDAENVAPPREEPPARGLASGVDGAVAFVLALVTVWICARQQTFGRDWEAAGESVAGRLTGGEWWRALTALTLHADAVHLAGNVVFGAAFVWFAGQLAGPGIALAATLLSGALGNALNALLQPADHHSIGASTAVFGVLGLVAALHFSQRARQRQSALYRWAPVVAAALLLFHLGTTGPRTDVLAHVAGFVTGLLLGVLLARPLRDGPPGPGWQWLFGLATLAALAGAWAAAFAAT